MNQYLAFIYSLGKHYKAVLIALLLGLLFIDYTFSTVTVNHMRVNSRLLTGEFTSDSTEVSHLVLQRSNGELKAMNNFQYSINAGQEVVFISLEGKLTGITYQESLYGIE